MATTTNGPTMGQPVNRPIMTPRSTTGISNRAIYWSLAVVVIVALAVAWGMHEKRASDYPYAKPDTSMQNSPPASAANRAAAGSANTNNANPAAQSDLNGATNMNTENGAVNDSTTGAIQQGTDSTQLNNSRGINDATQTSDSSGTTSRPADRQ